MSEQDLIRMIRDQKIVAIIRGVEEAHIVQTVQSLVDGGIRLLEVTFDHDGPDAAEHTARKIKRICECFGDQVTVGAGTVLTPNEVDAALSVGGQFIISPNVNVEVIRKTKQLNMISIPGAMTPTEVVTAHQAGADFVKLFPAGELGIGYIKALMEPLKHIPILLVGGVTPDHVVDFMKTGICGVGVGGNLVSRSAIQAGDYQQITTIAKQYIRKLNK